MPIGDRIHASISAWAEGWKDQLRGWLSRSIMESVNGFLAGNEPEAIDLAQAQLRKISEDPNTPPEIKALISKLLAGTQPLPVILLVILAAFMIIPMITSVAQPLGRLLEYQQDRVLETFRLDALSIITAWRRDPKAWEHLFGDLNDQGWSDDQIEALKFLTLFYPAPADLVRWQAREVFEPEMVDRYGLDSELDKIEKEPFYKAGMTDEQIRNYWRAHWEHPELRTIVEMLRRTDFSREDMSDWFRLVEIPPFWRDKLIDISYEVPTRVDVRRWWDMRTIDEVRLREVYTHQGYHGKDLDDYVLWTKVYTAWPDLIARWKNGWISLDDVREELGKMGMPAVRIQEMIETKLKAAQPERTEADRTRTVSDVYKGVKQGKLTRLQAVEVLMDLGFNRDEAEFKLDVNIPADEVEEAEKARELTKGDIKAAVKAGLMTPAQATQRFIDRRYTLADAQLLSTIYAAQIPIEEVQELRELSKADILAALRKGIMGEAEARVLLEGILYAPRPINTLVLSNPPPAAMVPLEEARQLSKSDLKTAYRVGEITADQLVERLVDLEYSPEDAALLVQIYQALEELKGIIKPREQSKADVVAAVKKGLLTPEEGYIMLQDLDFTPAASEFILAVRAEVSPFSPRDFAEFKARAAAWSTSSGSARAQGTPELQEAAKKVIEVEQDVEVLRRALAEEERLLVSAEVLPAAATAKRDDLRKKLRRAESEQSRIKNEWALARAEWLHGQG